MNRLDSLFSPRRLNKKWASPESTVEEDSVNKNVLPSTLLQQWEVCKSHFSNDFRSDQVCVQLMENIETQLSDIAQSNPVISKKKNKAMHNILLLERLCETQIITQQRSQRKNY